MALATEDAPAREHRRGPWAQRDEGARTTLAGVRAHWLTTFEASTVLRISDRMARKLALGRRVDAARWGGRWVLSRASVEEYAATRVRRGSGHHRGV
jgi:excisionase family DNA binding protein